VHRGDGLGIHVFMYPLSARLDYRSNYWSKNTHIYRMRSILLSFFFGFE
jgi:hypothetical protein